MKKLTSLLLVAVMILSSLALTVSAAPAFAGTEGALFTNADGDHLVPTYNNNTMAFEDGLLYVPATQSTHNFVTFERQPLNGNALEATFSFSAPEEVNNIIPGYSGNVSHGFGIIIGRTTSGEAANSHLTSDQSYYLLWFGRNNFVSIIRVGSNGCTSNSFNDSGASHAHSLGINCPNTSIVYEKIGSQNLDRLQYLYGNETTAGTEVDMETALSQGGTVSVKVEWDADYTFRVYGKVSNEYVLMCTAKDTNSVKPDLANGSYGVYMTGATSDGVQTKLVSFKAGVVSENTATVSATPNISYTEGSEVSASVMLNTWDESKSYKGIEAIVNVPEKLTVTDVTAGSSLEGGAVNYYVSDGKLRISYMDTENGSNITVTNTEETFAAFNITFELNQTVTNDAPDRNLITKVDKMQFIVGSDEDKLPINVTNAKATTYIVEKEVFTAVDLYVGDGTDVIPANKKAVLVTVTVLPTDAASAKKITYTKDDANIEFKFNEEISAKASIASYVAYVDATLAIDTDYENFTIEDNATILNFGDINGDTVLNGQDALAVVNFWTREESPTDDQILSANVNGDGCIDTRDALGIVEVFVDAESEYAIIAKAFAKISQQ